MFTNYDVLIIPFWYKKIIGKSMRVFCKVFALILRGDNVIIGAELLHTTFAPSSGYQKTRSGVA